MKQRVILKEKRVRPICEIAREIHSDWGKNIYFGAKPYLSAMLSLEKITDKYMKKCRKNVLHIGGKVMKLDSKTLIEDYNNGESMTAIAKKFHTYPTSIKRILEKEGI